MMRIIAVMASVVIPSWSAGPITQDPVLLKTEMSDLLTSTVKMLTEITDQTKGIGKLGSTSKTALEIAVSSHADLRSPDDNIPKQLRSIGRRVSQAISAVRTMISFQSEFTSVLGQADRLVYEWNRVSDTASALARKTETAADNNEPGTIFDGIERLLSYTVGLIFSVDQTSPGASSEFLSCANLKIPPFAEIKENSDIQNLNRFCINMRESVKRAVTVVGKKDAGKVKDLESMWAEKQRAVERKHRLAMKASVKKSIDVKSEISSAPLDEETAKELDEIYTKKPTKSQLRAQFKKDKKKLMSARIEEEDESVKNGETVREAEVRIPAKQVSEIRNEEEIIDETGFELVAKKSGSVKPKIISEWKERIPTSSPAPVIKQILNRSVTTPRPVIAKPKTNPWTIQRADRPNSVSVDEEKEEDPRPAADEVKPSEIANEPSESPAVIQSSESDIQIETDKVSQRLQSEINSAESMAASERSESFVKSSAETSSLEQIPEESSEPVHSFVRTRSFRNSQRYKPRSTPAPNPCYPHFYTMARPMSDFIASDLRTAVANSACTLPAMYSLCDQLFSCSADPRLQELSGRMQSKAACVAALIEEIRKDVETAAIVSGSLSSVPVPYNG